MEQQNTPTPTPQPTSQPTPTPTSAKKAPAMAIVAYILFFIPLLTGDAKKDSFVKFHVKQGLTLFILVVLINVIKGILPYQIIWSFGWIFWLLSLGTLVLLIMGISNAWNNKREPLPVIGKFADLFKF